MTEPREQNYCSEQSGGTLIEPHLRRRVSKGFIEIKGKNNGETWIHIDPHIQRQKFINLKTLKNTTKK